MEIVIDIPEGTYDLIKHNAQAQSAFENAYYAIRKGTPLPKGHGDLKDIGNIRLDKFIRIENISLNSRFSVEFKKGYNAAIDDALYVLMSAPVLIEADEEEAEQCDDDCEHCEWATCQKMEVDECGH